MLGKLIKHEFRATYKLFCSIYIGVLTMMLVNIATMDLDVFNNTILSPIRIIFLIGFVIAIIAVPFATIIYIAYRFYKNLFTDEGYLTFTLPAKRRDIVLSKYVTGVTWVIASIAVICVSGLLFFLGNYGPTNYGNLLLDFIKGVLSSISKDNLGIMISVLFYIAADILYAVSFLYLALAFGQLIFPKHKILGAVIAYFAIQIIQEILSGILLGIYTLFTDFTPSASGLPNSYYVIFGILLLGMTVLWLFLTSLICKKKLNLA